jgi:hypothetical protein
MNEWYERGVDQGWDHQNFVAAYGSEHDGTVTYPAQLEADSRYGFGGPGAHERAEGRREFARGWKDGRKLYRQGRYTDGTKIEEN